MASIYKRSGVWHVYYRQNGKRICYAGRISMLVKSLTEYQSKLKYFERKEQEVHDLYDNGKISNHEMVDRLTETGFSKQRAGSNTI